MKTPAEVSMKVQRVAGALSRVLIWNVNQSPSAVFLRGRIVFFLFYFIFFSKEAWNISKRKYHVSYYFLRKATALSFSVQGKNTMFPGKKYHLSSSTKKIMSQCVAF